MPPERRQRRSGARILAGILVAVASIGVTAYSGYVGIVGSGMSVYPAEPRTAGRRSRSSAGPTRP